MAGVRNRACARRDQAKEAVDALAHVRRRDREVNPDGGRQAQHTPARTAATTAPTNAGAASSRKRSTRPPPSSSSAAARLANPTGRTSTNAGDAAVSLGRVGAPRGLAPRRRHHARNVPSSSPCACANATCVDPLRRHACTTSAHRARFAALPLAMLASRAVHPLSREHRGNWCQAVGRRWSNAYEERALRGQPGTRVRN